MTDSLKFQHRRAIERWGRLLLLFVLFAQLMTSMVIKSPAFDEPAHLYQSCLIWRYDYEGGRPIHWLAGLFCLAVPELPQLDENPSLSVRDRGDFFSGLDIPIDNLLFPPRVLSIELVLLMGAVLYQWGRAFDKDKGGLLALGLLAFEPNILAHGRLFTTDIAITLLFVLCLYFFQRGLSRRQSKFARAGCFFAAALSLGLAFRSKPTAPILLVPMGLMVLAYIFFPPSVPPEGGEVGLSPPRRNVPRRSRAGELEGGTRPFPPGGMEERVSTWLRYIAALVGFTALVILGYWLLFGLSGSGDFTAQLLRPLRTITRGLNRLSQGPEQSRGWPAYMLGRRSFHGWILYFPLLFLVKTSLPLIGAAMAGVIKLLRSRRWDLLAAFSLPLWMLIAYTRLSLNIGYRHLLPVVPFLILLATYAMAKLRKGRTWVAAVLLLWFGLGSLRVYPDYLAYFNEIAGGPEGGIHFFTDSNLDWGQDLKTLRRWMDEHGVSQIYLSYFGDVKPEVYGINYQKIQTQAGSVYLNGFTPMSPPPGIYAISANHLTGQYVWENPSVFSWFHQQTPIAKLGHSIWIFEVEPDPDPPRWAAVCLPPGIGEQRILDRLPPLDFIEGLERGLGIDEDYLARLIPFDCSHGWPLGGPTDGDAWLLVPSLDGDAPAFLPPAGALGLVYEQEDFGGDVLYTVFRWTPTSPLGADGCYNSPPINLGGILCFEGACLSSWEREENQAERAADRNSPPKSGEEQGQALPLQSVEAGTTLEVHLTWRILQTPSEPSSFMAHLRDAEGQSVAVDDGSGVPPEHWRVGDRLIQVHRLPVPAATQSAPAKAAPRLYTLVTGAYTIPDIENLPIVAESSETADNTIVVGTFRVR